MKKERIRFSLIVSVYNSEKFLDACIMSLLDQMYENYEIILVDDGSTDHSGQICDRYQKQHPSRITVIHQHNQGQIRARIHGVAAVTGEYVCFIDSDDVASRNLLKETGRVLNRRLYDVVIFSYQRIYEDGTLYKRVPHTKLRNGAVAKEAFIRAWNQDASLNALWRKMFRRELMAVWDPDDPVEIIKAGDLYLGIPLIAKAGSFYYLDRCLISYRMNAASISNTYKRNTWRSNEIVKERNYRFLQKAGVNGPEDMEKFFWNSLHAVWQDVKGISALKADTAEKTAILEEMAGYPFTKRSEKYLGRVVFSRGIRHALRLFYREEWNRLLFYLAVYRRYLDIRERILYVLKRVYNKLPSRSF